MSATPPKSNTPPKHVSKNATYFDRNFSQQKVSKVSQKLKECIS